MNINFPPKALKVFSSNGKDIIQEIGLDIIKGVVLDVLTGKNIRDSTELLTRKRILSLNAATLVMLIKGGSNDNFIQNLPAFATERLKQGRLTKQERWLMQWILGLTDKAFQNVLRDDSSSIEKYKNSYIDIIKKAIEVFQQDYGSINGFISLNSKEKAKLNWNFVVQLMNIVGAQTLAIRGSDKSTFGKLFEKLILGALLTILGFRLVDPEKLETAERVFWLTSKDEKRESDATLLYEAGKGVRFDIGFIGRGNPEISLDKVTRFEKELDHGKRKWFTSTIIIVDRIGKNSSIEQLAKAVNGDIVQMSGSFWPLQVAKILKHTCGYDNKILHTSLNDMNEYLKQKIKDVPFEQILNIDAFTKKQEETV